GGPDTPGDPAQHAAVGGSAGVLRLVFGHFGKRRWIRLYRLGDLLCLGMGLFALRVVGVGGDVDLDVADIDAGRLDIARLVLLVLFLELVFADRCYVFHGRCLVQEQVLSAGLLWQLQTFLVGVVPGLDVGVGQFNVFFVIGGRVRQQADRTLL